MNHGDVEAMAEDLPIVDVKKEPEDVLLKEEEEVNSSAVTKKRSSKRRSASQKEQAAKNLKKIVDDKVEMKAKEERSRQKEQTYKKHLEIRRDQIKSQLKWQKAFRGSSVKFWMLSLTFTAKNTRYDTIFTCFRSRNSSSLHENQNLSSFYLVDLRNGSTTLTKRFQHHLRPEVFRNSNKF